MASTLLQGDSQICSFRSCEKGSLGAVIEYVQDDSSVTADANCHRPSIDPPAQPGGFFDLTMTLLMQDEPELGLGLTHDEPEREGGTGCWD
jgi:hypothetical protein